MCCIALIHAATKPASSPLHQAGNTYIAPQPQHCFQHCSVRKFRLARPPHFSSELSTHGCRVAPHLYSWNITTKAIRIGVGMDTACQARKTYSCKFYVNFLVGIFCFIQSISKHIGFLNVFDRFPAKMRNLTKHITVNFL